MVYPSPLTARMIDELCGKAALLGEHRWIPASSGNFSVYDSRQKLVWVSGTGIDKSGMNRDDFVPVRFEQGEAIAPSSCRSELQPSEEASIHYAIYDRVRRARAVIHAHPPHCNLYFSGLGRRERDSFALSHKEILKVITRRDWFDGIEVRVLENFDKKQMKQARQVVSAWLEPSIDQFVVLRDHGVWSWGQTPEEAFFRLQALECTAMELLDGR